ncbi:hypothetical protein F5Y01DRAFT_283668 [Xylaria sp. FL0043]|nr:hypothetical protein F5Y01DRAFT_283668 [Xylaria sp. FL0043]
MPTCLLARLLVRLPMWVPLFSASRHRPTGLPIYLPVYLLLWWPPINPRASPRGTKTIARTAESGSEYCGVIDRACLSSIQLHESSPVRLEAAYSVGT